jgi:hypothetical protein
MNISSIIICFRLKIFIYIFIKKDNNIYIEICEKYIHLNDNDDNEYKIIKESFNDTLINLKINYVNLYNLYKLSLIYETFYENNILTSKYYNRLLTLSKNNISINYKISYINETRILFQPTILFINKIKDCIFDYINKELDEIEISIQYILYEKVILLIICYLEYNTILNENCILKISEYL